MSIQSDVFSRDSTPSEEDLSDEEKRQKTRDSQDHPFYNQHHQQQQNSSQNSQNRNNRDYRDSRPNNRSNTQQTRQRSNLQNQQQNSRQYQQIQYCNYEFHCGHKCEKKKNRKHKQHMQMYCSNCLRNFDLPCDKKLQCGHHCQQLARYNPCPPCEQEVTLTLKCEHEIKIKCKSKNAEYLCNMEVTKLLVCDHEIQFICHQRQQLLCNKPCERLLKCQHKCQLKCSDDCSNQICKQRVLKQLECQHEEWVECYKIKQSTTCLQLCEKKLKCGHNCKALCKNKCPEDFHDFCEDRLIGECYDTDSENFEQSINQAYLIQKYNSHYQTQLNINIEIKREVDAELFIFKQLFKDKIEQIIVGQNYQSHQRKLIRYLQRDDIYDLVDDQQFKFMKDMTLNLIIQHYKQTRHQIDYLMEYSEIQQYKLFNYYLGKIICKQKLICGHLCDQFFHLDECICQIKEITIMRQCGHTIITGCHNREYAFANPCNQICNRKLECDHYCQKLCKQDCVCEQMIFIKQQGCDHKKKIICGGQQSHQICYEMKKITFEKCLHTKQVLCYDQTKYLCKQSISNTCNRCKTITQIKCRDKDKFVCNQMLKIKLQNCLHEKEVLCRDSLINYQCHELIDNICPRCDQICQIVCMNKPNYQCQNKITITYDNCTHYQQVSCYQQDLFVNCKINITICSHQQNIECYKGIFYCQKNCGKLLQCSHLCKMRCFVQCECYEKIKYRLNCGHDKQIFCNQQALAVCDEICNKKLKCKHLCMQKCIEQCQCLQMVEHIFLCGHKISITCGEQTNLLICQQYKEVIQPCSHKQIRQCKDKNIQKCKYICNKTLPCGDKCQQQCYERCKCVFEIKKIYPCLHFAEGCSKKIPQTCQERIQCVRPCGHQISKICSGELNSCEKKCNKLLKCNHLCEDICGKECQPKCHLCLKEDQQSNYLLGSMVFQQDFQLVNEQKVDYSQLHKNQICNRQCKSQVGQLCQCDKTFVYQCQSCLNKFKMECRMAQNYQCMYLLVIQCELCKQEQMIVCGGQLQCRCTKTNSDQNQKGCKVILSCNHLCGGTLCTSNFHELCNQQSICQHQQKVYCSGRSPCQLCSPQTKEQQQKDQKDYYLSSYTIQNLPSLKNRIYEKNRILLNKIAQDDKLKYMINSAYHKFLELKLQNLIAYQKEDKKIFLNISKYSIMERIEKSDFYLTSQQLKDL